MIRQQIVDLVKMGPFPASKDATDAIETQEKLLLGITKPVTDDEARELVKVFGPDDYFGMVWPVIHLVESAPGWPLADCLAKPSNEWVELLATRVRNREQPPPDSPE